MWISRRILLVTLSLIILFNNSSAQNQQTATTTQTPVAAVTASASGNETVRFSAPGQTLQIRLEIYSADGALVSDSGLRQGSVVDWRVTDASRAMTDGQYVTVVTVRDLDGKFRQRVGGISLQSGQITLKNLPAEQLTAAQTQVLQFRRQSQKIEAGVNTEAITILREGKERSVVVTAHDGQDGQIATTNGPLTFRTGDFFSNRAREQMRIMPDGRVGIGTDRPEATLDVAGTIRARGGIKFEDGTVLTSATGIANQQNGVALSVATGNSLAPNTAGVGTANRIAKWTDSTGTLGDSAITESGGRLGIGTTTPTNKLHIVGGTVLHQFSTNPGGEYGFYGAINNNHFTSNLAFDGQWKLMTAGKGSGFAAAPQSDMAFSVFMDNTPRAAGANASLDTKFVIKMNGDVGIGTTAPTQKLDVAGNIKINGASNGIIFSDGTKMTTAGGSVTGTSMVSAINDAATAGTISDNRLSLNLGRLNGANAWSGANVFAAGLSANNAPITNVASPVNAGDAVNRGFFDTNAIRFVPGAEQLSVGDANGTAAMINLRGGSTCCSGPGGHTPAFFKVFQNGSFIATGNLGIGVSPMEGKGYRTSWHTYKGAFRSGYADNEWDDANTGFFSWAGGSNSTASGLYALAFGDTNFATSTSSIVFGSGNEVKGAAGFSAGAGNRVCDTYGVAFGNKAQSGGPLINGKCDPETFNITGLAAIAMGYNVTADKDHTTAMGKFASNNGFSGTFVWSDGSAANSADTFRNTANNEFAARATGGFRFRTNLAGTTGCNLPAGSGVFNCTSSRATKANFMMVNGEDVLSRLRVIPVSTWNYISEGDTTRHMGPMAEDFYQAFKLGTGNTSIGVQDLTGVSLAAIKALDQRTNELQQKTAEVEQLRAQVSELRLANDAFEKRLVALEQKQRTPARRSNTSGAHR
jgi:hypothetical protein